MEQTLTTLIEAWLGKQPVWIHRAAVRLCDGEAISPELIQDVANDCLRYVAKQTVDRPESINLLAYDTPISENAFALKGIFEVAGVNRIVDQSNLQLHCTPESTGLSVVYGLNGSGKTGFSRILKVSSGNTPSRRILPDVFNANHGALGWTIRCTDGTDDLESKFQSDSEIPPHLNAVQVFDEELANSYHIEDRELSLAPPALKLFDDLILLLDGAKSEISRRRDIKFSKLPSPPPSLQQQIIQTPFSRLGSIKTLEIVRSTFDFIEADRVEFDALKQELSLHSSPEAIRSLGQKIAAVKQLGTDLDKIEAQLSQTSVNRLSNLKNDVIQAEKLVIASNQVLSDTTKLEGVGSSQWRSLWNAARAFSDEIAYASEVFPVTTADAKCVLCQQELQEPARARFIRFEEFVQGAATVALTKAQTAFKTVLDDLPSEDRLDGLFTRVRDLADLKLSEESISLLRLEITSAFKSLRNCEENSSDRKILQTIIGQVKAVERALEAQLQLASDPEKAKAREELSKRRDELAAKEWLASQAESLCDEWTRLQEVALLEKARTSISTADATMEKGKLYERLVTNEVVGAFIQELKTLSASNLKVTISKTKGSKGKVLHRPVLVGSFRAASPNQVLSEGEQKVLALAAFLADSTTAKNRAPFVFDDPVSSLDHRYENALAKRLAELGKHRQVIVFTHRLSFVSALETASSKCGCSTEKFGLHSNLSGSGIQGEFPMDRTPKKIANEVINDCQRLQKDIGAMNPDEVRNALLGPFARMRRAVEQCVEKVLLSGIVKRFDQAIHTDAGLINLTKITAEDCQLIDGLMTVYSREIHDQSEERDDTPIDVKQIMDDASDLIKWIDDFTKRDIEPK